MTKSVSNFWPKHNVKNTNLVFTFSVLKKDKQKKKTQL